jgi:hypothetical protein
MSSSPSGRAGCDSVHGTRGACVICGKWRADVKVQVKLPCGAVRWVRLAELIAEAVR